MAFSLADLEAIIAARAQSSAAASYTRSLLEAGTARCAKKFGEEAIETVIAAVQEDRAAFVAETADALYHLLVLVHSRGVTLQDALDELERRTTQSGHQEKAARGKPSG
jgi:phosphoribosyl-ATP pyrophosphohydrolase